MVKLRHARRALGESTVLRGSEPVGDLPSSRPDEFKQRLDRELGYQPHELRRRISEFDLEFIPRLDSLQLDSSELLDPQ